MISTGRQYGVRSPMVTQYHPIRDKKVCLFNKITRYRIMSPSRSCREGADHSVGTGRKPIEVDHSRLDQAAELMQMVPSQRIGLLKNGNRASAQSATPARTPRQNLNGAARMVLVYAIGARPFRRGDAFRGSRNRREKTAGK